MIISIITSILSKYKLYMRITIILAAVYFIYNYNATLKDNGRLIEQLFNCKSNLTRIVKKNNSDKAFLYKSIMSLEKSGQAKNEYYNKLLKSSNLECEKSLELLNLKYTQEEVIDDKQNLKNVKNNTNDSDPILDRLNRMYENSNSR